MLQPLFTLPKKMTESTMEKTNHGQSPEQLSKWNTLYFSPFFPGLSLISDTLSILFFLKPSQSHLFSPTLVTTPSHWLLTPFLPASYMLAFPQALSKTSLYSHCTHLLGNPVAPEDSMITYMQWLSRVCPIPSSSPELQCHLPPCSRDESTSMFHFKLNVSKGGLSILP